MGEGMTSTTANVSSDQFAIRRTTLMNTLSNGAIILTAGHDTPRNNDVDHEFRQLSDFWYFTGFDEPDAVALIRPNSENQYILFVNPYDPRFEIWVGHRAGTDGAVSNFGADLAYPVEELAEKLPDLLSEVADLQYSIGSDSIVDPMISKLVSQRRAGSQRGGPPLLNVTDPQSAIDQMRLIKSELEIESLQNAIDITGRGFESAMRSTNPGSYEYQVQAEMEVNFRRMGSPRNGYPSIVASGGNACILHYIKNRARLNDGDLLLIDAGAEIDFYTADITRTWPVNGKFSPEQRAVYQIVLDAQANAFDAIIPGAGFDKPHMAALRTLVQGLKDLKVLDGSVDGLIEEQAYRPYYMHGTSHWLGLDVHDSGPYRNADRATELQSGMVFTIEPGLYFGTQATESPSHLKGIGIRIEDDVLVTNTGHKVLSSSIPSEIDDIENLVGKGF